MEQYKQKVTVHEQGENTELDFSYRGVIFRERERKKTRTRYRV